METKIKKVCEPVAPAFLLYEEALKGFLLNKTKDADLAGEILRQVLLKVYNNCEKLAEVQNVKAWLFQITRNALYDYYKEQQKTTDIEAMHEEDEPEMDAPEEEIKECIKPLMRLLPDKYYQPLKMYDLEGIPQKEIAEKLGLSHGAVRVQIKRGREKLRELFLECCDLEMDSRGRVVAMEVKDSCKPLKGKC
ncbi:MAG: sigma-70 family RNA polymerase sigma factor [Bacteroidia bacterium]